MTDTKELNAVRADGRRNVFKSAGKGIRKRIGKYGGRSFAGMGAAGLVVTFGFGAFATDQPVFEERAPSGVPFETVEQFAAEPEVYAELEVAAETARGAKVTTLLETGTASFYGAGFAGKPTANGESFNPSALTAAHPTLPFGTEVKVTNVRTGKSVVVRINDRGPFAKNRVIDLSREAASRIGMVNSGTAPVHIERVAS
jgi:rare lipoprotein A